MANMHSAADREQPGHKFGCFKVKTILPFSHASCTGRPAECNGFAVSTTKSPDFGKLKVAGRCCIAGAGQESCALGRRRRDELHFFPEDRASFHK